MVCSLRSNWREEKEAEEDYQKQVVRRRKGTDEEARWVYKQKRYHYGYKKHCPANVQGIVQKETIAQHFCDIFACIACVYQ